MFRVLSDEETQHVVRWKAPDFNSSHSNVASTRQLARPDTGLAGKTVTPLLGSAALKRLSGSAASASLKLDLVAPTDVTTLDASTLRNAAPFERPIATASADMLQASYDEGYSKGLADLKKAMLNKKAHELNDIVTSLSNAREETQDAELEKEIVGLSMDIARRIIGQELSVDTQIIAQLVTRGLKQLHSSKADTTCIHLNPADADCVRQHVSLPEELTLVEDSTLERGSCHIESGSSMLRVGVDDWLENVAKELGFTGYERDVSEPQRNSPPSNITSAQE